MPRQAETVYEQYAEEFQFYKSFSSVIAMNTVNHPSHPSCPWYYLTPGLPHLLPLYPPSPYVLRPLGDCRHSLRLLALTIVLPLIRFNWKQVPCWNCPAFCPLKRSTYRERERTERR